MANSQKEFPLLWESNSTSSQSEGSDCDDSPMHLHLTQNKKLKVKRMRSQDDDAIVPERKGPWSEWEEMELIKRHCEIGNKWATISKFLPGRSDNGVKNHWNSTLRSKSMTRHQTLLWIYAKQVEAVADSKEGRYRIFKKAKEEQNTTVDKIEGSTRDVSSQDTNPDSPVASNNQAMEEGKSKRSAQSLCDSSQLSLKSQSPDSATASIKVVTVPASLPAVRMKYANLNRGISSMNSINSAVASGDDTSILLGGKELRPIRTSYTHGPGSCLGLQRAAVKKVLPSLISAAAKQPCSISYTSGEPTFICGKNLNSNSFAPMSAGEEAECMEEDSLVQMVPATGCTAPSQSNLCAIYREWSSPDSTQDLPFDTDLPHSPATRESEACGFQFSLDEDVPMFEEGLLTCGSSDTYNTMAVNSDGDGVDPTLIAASVLTGSANAMSYALDDYALAEDLLDPSPCTSFEDPLNLSYPPIF